MPRRYNRTVPHSIPKHLPTPEQIREACEAIRAKWPDWIERQRRISKPGPYTTPIVRVSEIDHD